MFRYLSFVNNAGVEQPFNLAISVMGGNGMALYMREPNISVMGGNVMNMYMREYLCLKCFIYSASLSHSKTMRE